MKEFKYFKSQAIKRKLYLTTGCSFFSVFFIVFLYKLSGTPNAHNNGFNRKFGHSSLLIPTYYKDIKSSSYYISGKTFNQVYFSSYNSPSQVIIGNNNLSDTQHLYVNISESERSSTLMIKIDSPFIYLINRETHSILSYSLLPSIKKDLAIYRTDKIKFNSSEIISPSSFIFRTADTVLKKNILIKVNSQLSNIKQAPNVLEKQLDGYFCTDGMLRYDPISSKIIYIYYYRNRFICLDTNLSIIYKTNTIDTITKAKIKVGRIASSDHYTFSAPPIIVNQKCCIARDRIFIQSGLLADNEDRQTFGKSSAVDVYDLNNGHYLFSFHILDFDGFKVSDFQVLDTTLIAVQGHYIVNYPINF